MVCVDTNDDVIVNDMKIQSGNQMIMWLQLIVPIVVSALVSACAPKRWLVRSMVAWVLSPALVYWVMAISELFGRSIPKNAFGTYLFGFMLIASVMAIPWAVMCVVGFAMGFVVRRRFQRKTGGSAPQPVSIVHPSSSNRVMTSSRQSGALVQSLPTRAALTARPPFDSIERDAGWREAHIGFANSGLRLDGLEVWKEKWRSLHLPSVNLPHPAYRQQIHAYDIYEIGPLEKPVRFAVGELSNGVWGFYIPQARHGESGHSVDGSITFIREGVRHVDGRDDSDGWIILSETSTGRVLADCKSWDSSEVETQPDGSLFLRLQANGFETVVRIAPVARNFSDLAEAGANIELSNLTNTLESRLLAIHHRDRAPIDRRISRDGRFRVDLYSVEWANTHWVNSPRLIENRTGQVHLDLWSSAWDATVTLFDAHRLRLDMRCYGRACNAELEIDLNARSFQLACEGRSGRTTQTDKLEYLPKTLAEVSAQGHSTLSSAWPQCRPQRLVSPFAAWRIAVMILVAAIIVIALVAVVARNTSQHAAQKLDKVPAMLPTQRR